MRILLPCLRPPRRIPAGGPGHAAPELRCPRGGGHRLAAGVPPDPYRQPARQRDRGGEVPPGVLAREGFRRKSSRSRRAAATWWHACPAPARAAAPRPPAPHRCGARRLQRVEISAVLRGHCRRRRLGSRRPGHQGSRHHPAGHDGGAQAAGCGALARPHPRGQSGRGARFRTARSGSARAQGGPARQRGVFAQRGRREHHGRTAGTVSYGLDATEKVPYWVPLAVRGEPGHGSRPTPGTPPCVSPGCWAASPTGRRLWS